LRALKPHQPGVRKIEWNGKAQRPIGGEKLLGQPHVRERNNPAGGKLSVQPRHTASHQRGFEPQGQVAQAQAKQGFVRRFLKVNRWVPPGRANASTHGALIRMQRGAVMFLVHVARPKDM
jgi:hypothetical protein